MLLAFALLLGAWAAPAFAEGAQEAETGSGLEAASPEPQNGQQQSPALGNSGAPVAPSAVLAGSEKFEDIFPDGNLADFVASYLRVAVTDLVTQSD